MTLIVCDICKQPFTELRDKRNYGWFSKAGVVVICNGRAVRLHYEGRDLKECCLACLPKTMARIYTSDMKGYETPRANVSTGGRDDGTR